MPDVLYKFYEGSSGNFRTIIFRSSHRRSYIKKGFLKILQHSQENSCVRVSISIKLQAWGTTQVFYCINCEIFKNTYSEEHLRKAASQFPDFSLENLLRILNEIISLTQFKIIF